MNWKNQIKIPTDLSGYFKELELKSITQSNMKQFIKECITCEGTGIQGRNNSWDNHPSRDEVWACDYCEEGKVHDQDALDEAIMDAQDMIDGMITRIRLTSDNIKMVAKFEMLPDFMARYKHRLQIQARALARLEMYKANLQNL